MLRWWLSGSMLTPAAKEAYRMRYLCLKQLELLGKAAQLEDIEQLWCLPGEWKTNLSKILDLPLWNRIWIMQEVTSNQSVIVQCREHIVPWDFLCRVIMQSQTSDHLDVSANLRQFVSRI